MVNTYKEFLKKNSERLSHIKEAYKKYTLEASTTPKQYMGIKRISLEEYYILNLFYNLAYYRKLLS